MKDIVFKTIMLKGADGSSIATIEKTGTSGNVDTYTVTLSDGQETTFEVTNGSSISTIEKTGTSGLVDTYTVTLTNGDTTTFEVTNGASYEVPKDGVILFDGSTAPEGYEIIPNPTSSTTSLSFIKKVSDTIQSGFGRIIDSFNTGDNKETNAPSLKATIERTDNNLLINGELTTQPTIDLYYKGDTYSVSTSLLGWTTLFNSSNSGLKIPSSSAISYPSTFSQTWYDSHQVDEIRATMPYLTVSLEYRLGSSGDFTKLVKTFNISEATSSTSIALATIGGMALSLKPLVGGRAVFSVSQAPSSDVYIKNVKLERGTGATEYKQDMTFYSAMRGAIESIFNRYEKDIIDYNSDINAIKSRETYKTNDTVNFVYYGGCYWAPIPNTLKKEVSFNIPLAKPVTLPIGSTMPTITLNEVVTDEGFDLTDILSVESVEFDINSSDRISNYAILRLSYLIVQEPIEMENIHGLKADIDVTFS